MQSHQREPVTVFRHYQAFGRFCLSPEVIQRGCPRHHVRRMSEATPHRFRYLQVAPVFEMMYERGGHRCEGREDDGNERESLLCVAAASSDTHSVQRGGSGGRCEYGADGSRGYFVVAPVPAGSLEVVGLLAADPLLGEDITHERQVGVGNV